MTTERIAAPPGVEPYWCGGPQNGKPQPHTACNCTPRPLTAAPDSLDAAWQEAEAALPEGWEHLALRLARDFGTNGRTYIAEAGVFDDSVGDDGWSGPQPTPAQALRELASRLRDAAREPLA